MFDHFVILALKGIIRFSHRLGGGVRDAEDVMAHKFFELINWNDILQKKSNYELYSYSVGFANPVDITCSKSTMETPEQGAKSVQS